MRFLDGGEAAAFALFLADSRAEEASAWRAPRRSAGLQDEKFNQGGGHREAKRTYRASEFCASRIRAMFETARPRIWISF